MRACCGRSVAKVGRYFNTEGLCKPDKHYMVDLADRLDKIKRLYIDREKYFIINRGRQYGKTTTLRALAEYLKNDYMVISLDFQGISTEEYANEYAFTKAFMRLFFEILKRDTVNQNRVADIAAGWGESSQFTIGELFHVLSRICNVASKPVVMMIDEVDSASNKQVFIDFLAQLRMYYLDRDNRPIFHSVVLAGVYDIKNLKLKIRPDEEHQYNSPWNIAAKFSIDMDFSAEQIAAMLQEYEDDNCTGMNVSLIAESIYGYTSGYPYLVSAICKIMDEELPGIESFRNPAAVWTKEGVAEAVKLLLKESSTLFDSMVKQLDSYKELREMIKEIIYQGRRIIFSPAEKPISLAIMFGFLKEEDGRLVVANRIYEMYLLNLFISEEAVNSAAYQCGDRDRNQFVRNGRLDMDLVLQKFVKHFTDIYGENDEKFLEAYGRKFFLLYLKPIINGTGNYYLEAQTRDAGRTDVIVDYSGEQFVIEMKIWRGNEYNERGEEQLTEYLDYFHQTKGYMLSFNFNKKKQVGLKTIRLGDKIVVEAVV